MSFWGNLFGSNKPKPEKNEPDLTEFTPTKNRDLTGDNLEDLYSSAVKMFNAVLQTADTLIPSPKVWQDVIRDLSKIIDAGMFKGSCLYLRARAYHYSGMYEKAIADLDMLLRNSLHRNPMDYPPPRRLRAMAKIKLGKFDEAENDLHEEIQISPPASLHKSDDYYWLLVCKFKGDENAAMNEQAKYFQ